MRYLVLVFTILVVAAACTGSQQADTPPTTAIPTTTAVPITTVTPTTVAAATTVTSPPPRFALTPPDLAPPVALPGSGNANGSGCAPGAGPLPDGLWFGTVVAKGASSIDFDLACFFFGDIAYTEGAADGEEVDDDYYVRNNNPAIRTVPVASGATVYNLDDGSVHFSTFTFADWTPHPSPLAIGYWLAINDGAVTEIMEQYAP